MCDICLTLKIYATYRTFKSQCARLICTTCCMCVSGCACQQKNDSRPKNGQDSSQKRAHNIFFLPSCLLYIRLYIAVRVQCTLYVCEIHIAESCPDAYREGPLLLGKRAWCKTGRLPSLSLIRESFDWWLRESLGFFSWYLSRRKWNVWIRLRIKLNST